MRVRADVVVGRGAPRTLELDAPSLGEARLHATRMGYCVLSCRAVALEAGRFFGHASGRGSRRFDVVIFIEQLRDLLVAGLSIIEALGALRRAAHGDTVAPIEHLERALKTGKALSDALAQEPAFPSLLVALVRSAELTSDLPQTLGRFLEHEQRVTELRQRLVSASIYPLLLTGVGALVLSFLLFYVMPRFARVFEGMTGELPWSARAMVAWSHLLGEHAVVVLGGLAAITAAVLLLAGSPRWRAVAVQRLLAWSPLRTRLHTYFLARWYRATGMLVSGGIPLPQALALSNPLLPAGLQAAGRQVERGVRDGLTPSEAHTRAGMATPVAEQLMIAGERTGDLGSVLTRIARFHEAEVARTLERGMRTIEPLVMVLIGLGVGIVVVLMYLPIFELASAIQ